jgi:hypothetical protein
VKIQSPLTSSAAKTKNLPEETTGETKLVEAKEKPLVEPKGKRPKKNPIFPGLSLEKHHAIPSFDDVSVLSLLHYHVLICDVNLCSFVFLAHHEEVYSTWY